MRIITKITTAANANRAPEKVKRIYGKDTNEAYCNAADYIVEHYDMNGNLR